MRFKLISCEIFFREMCSALLRSPHRVDVEFLPKGLHDIGQERMVARLQEVLDAVDDSEYDAILFGYGLCNNGLVGLSARNCPLVIPRAHDCITLFFGSKEKYQAYFDSNPGTYFLTSGWLERGQETGQLGAESVQERTGMNLSYDELVQQYGEDNAKYLWETLGDGLHNYAQYTYIEMGVEPDNRFEEQAREKAADKNWEFRKEAGNMRLIESLVNGEWNDEDFLTVPPGFRIVAKHDGRVVAAEPAKQQ